MTGPSRLALYLDRRLYPDHADRWDDRAFRRAVLAELSGTERVLDLGAGAGVVPEMCFRDQAAHVAGLDPDPRVEDNPHLDEAKIGVGQAVPWEDGSFDLVVADNVLEHLERPETVFREVARVLAPGGRFLAKTPNRRHYVPLFARLTPHRFHRAFNRLRGRAEKDTFPTRYRANSPKRLRELAADAGLSVGRIELIEGRPEYLRKWPLAYLLGWLYERVVNLLPGLTGFRVLMIATFRKPDG